MCRSILAPTSVILAPNRSSSSMSFSLARYPRPSSVTILLSKERDRIEVEFSRYITPSSDTLLKLSWTLRSFVSREIRFRPRLPTAVSLRLTSSRSGHCSSAFVASSPT